MWTARIFFAIVFSGIGFMLWFLFGLFREERAHSTRHARSLSPAQSPPRLRLRNQASTMQQEHDTVTLRLVSWFGADRTPAKEEPSCGM
jgi:hypothetical protein